MLDGAAERATNGRVRLAGIEFDALSEEETVSSALGELRRGRGGWILPVNLDVLRLATSSPETRELLSEPDVVVADGQPLIWASRLQGARLPDRVAGSNLIWSLSGEAARVGRSVFLLGGDPGAAETAAERLRARHPGLLVAGVCCPPYGFERDVAELDRIVREVRAATPDIVFVGLGFPKQEHLIRLLRPHLPGTWFVSVGISISFAAGRVRRAPRWMQRLGLEWIHRLAQEPRRLASRYLVHGLPFAARLLLQAAARRRSGGEHGVDHAVGRSPVLEVAEAIDEPLIGGGVPADHVVDGLERV
jgi:N-acetylglucosaminyldiphosphoundecaprenol N-acetyl-beta-D-mannosaminyltransferase